MDRCERRAESRADATALLWLLAAAGTFFARAASAQDTVTFLSDMRWQSAYGSDRPLYSWQDTYVKNDAPYNTGGGTTVVIGGATYAKALTAVAASEVIYDLGRKYSSFQAEIGITDICNGGSYGTAVFKVYCDGSLAYASGVIDGGSARSITVSVSGVTELRLVTEDAGDGHVCDESVWANARLKPAAPAGPPSSAPVKMLHSGNSMSPNSLTDQTMQFAISSGYDYIWDFHDNYYNNLKNRWDAGTDSATPRGRIASGRYTHYDLQPASEEYETEAGRADFYQYANLFHDLAKQYGLEVFLYCNWDRHLTSEAEQSIKDSVYNAVADSMGPDVTVIPVGRALWNIKNAWTEGEMADFDPVMLRYQLNPTDNHQSDFGAYINALVHYAAVFRQSPVGLPTYNLLHNTLYGVTDSTVMGVSDETVLKMQQIVWNTVKSYSHARVDTTFLPKAVLSSSTTVTAVNIPVSFDASSSAPVSGASITGYRWTFGDVVSIQNRAYRPSGTTCDNGHTTPVFETTTPVISHAYLRAGEFWVRLVVVQDDGKTSSAYMVVNVTETTARKAPGAPPSVTASGLAPAEYSVYTVTGARLRTDASPVHTGSAGRAGRPALAPGMYLARARSADRCATVKLVVPR